MRFRRASDVFQGTVVAEFLEQTARKGFAFRCICRWSDSSDWTRPNGLRLWTAIPLAGWSRTLRRPPWNIVSLAYRPVSEIMREPSFVIFSRRKFERFWLKGRKKAPFSISSGDWPRTTSVTRPAHAIFGAGVKIFRSRLAQEIVLGNAFDRFGLGAIWSARR